MVRMFRTASDRVPNDFSRSLLPLCFGKEPLACFGVRLAMKQKTDMRLRRGRCMEALMRLTPPEADWAQGNQVRRDVAAAAVKCFGKPERPLFPNLPFDAACIVIPYTLYAK
jgi:hypothetical protein